MKKLSILSLIVLASILMVFSTVNFNEFQSEKYGFKMLIPEGATKNTQTDTMIDWLYNTKDGALTISVNVMSLSGLTPDKYINMIRSSKESQFDNVKDYKISNGKALIYTDKLPKDNDGFYRYYIIAMNKDGKLYNVLVGGKKNTTLANKELVEKIIKSFDTLK